MLGKSSFPVVCLLLAMLVVDSCSVAEVDWLRTARDHEACKERHDLVQCLEEVEVSILFFLLL